MQSQIGAEMTPVQKAVFLHGRSLRAILLMMLLTTILGGYGWRLANLQLVHGAENRERAENNRIRLLPMPANRGRILDRKGRVLAANRLSRSVYLWPKDQKPEEWPKLAERLSPILEVPAPEILRKIEEAGYQSALPVRISQHISPTTFIALAEQAGDIRAVEVRTESNRYYPHGNLAAHLLGYIGEATLEELKANPKYPMGMIVGKMGVENLANETLQGVWGNRLIEVDAKGQELEELGVESPIPGDDVQLTLDLEMQKAAEKTLGNRRGAVVALDLKTGGVLAMASGPSFNPNTFTRQLTETEWTQLQAPDKPLLNRALQGYPPGSTFKAVTAIAGIESGAFTPSSVLGTYSAITIGGIAFHEHSGSYGVIGFRDALAYSSNTFFYQVGVRTGAEQISKWGKELGIGGTINLDLLGLDGANHGQIPTPAEKVKLYGEDWYLGDTVTMAIGQGLVLVTPLESAVMVGTIAKGGARVQPHVLASQSPEAKPIKTNISAPALNVVRQGLVDVVTKGTGRSLNDGSIPLTGGKTGTVEIPGHPDNAMYIGFGPVDNPQVAIAVAVEGGGYGSVGAAPIAKEVFKAYFQQLKP